MAKPSHSKIIATTETTASMKTPLFVYGLIGVIGFAVSAIITGVLMITGACTPSFFTFVQWSVTGTLALPLIGAGFFREVSRRVKEVASDNVNEAIAGLADGASLPTKAQMKELLEKRTPVSFTVNGVSGAQLTAKVQRDKVGRSYSNYDDEEKLELSITTTVPDNGVENFQRLLQRAIEGNKDIKTASEAIQA